MKRGLWLAIALTACAAPPPAAEPEPLPHFPPHSAPLMPGGALGEPDDRVVEWGARGQWLAVCRPEDQRRVPRLILDATTEQAFDQLEGSDETGRYVVFTRRDHRWLYDVQSRQAEDLGLIAETTYGDVGHGMLVYGRQAPKGPQVVVHTIGRPEPRVLPSPLPTLHRVEVDPTGRALWLTTFEPDDDEQRGYLEEVQQQYRQQTMCADALCTAFAPRARHREGVLWLGGDHDATFIDLDEWPLHRRTVPGAVVIENEQGVELVYADRRERIAGDGCSVVRGYGDPNALLLRCAEQQTTQYSLWRNGRAEPLEFEGDGDGDDYRSNLVSGSGSRWLELSKLRVIQAVEHQRWGHVFGDHVLMVGDDVEIRDVRTDTQVLKIPAGGKPLTVRGPYVVLGQTVAGDQGGRVIDVRDGHVERTFDGELLQLAPSGQVALRDDDGRIYWTP